MTGDCYKVSLYGRGWVEARSLDLVQRVLVVGSNDNCEKYSLDFVQLTLA